MRLNEAWWSAPHFSSPEPVLFPGLWRQAEQVPVPQQLAPAPPLVRGIRADLRISIS